MGWLSNISDGVKGLFSGDSNSSEDGSDQHNPSFISMIAENAAVGFGIPRAIVKMFESIFKFFAEAWKAVSSLLGFSDSDASKENGGNSGGIVQSAENALSGMAHSLENTVENKFHSVENTVSNTLHGWGQSASNEFHSLKESVIKAPEEIKNMAFAAAEKHGIDPHAWLAVQSIESGFKTNIVNAYSKATGLVQFTKGTANDYGSPDWDRTDPLLANEYGCQHWNKTKQELSDILGRPATDAETYCGWQQGAGGAGVMLKHANDGTLAWQALMETKKYRNDPEKAKEAIVQNGGSESMTAGEFSSKWINEFNRRYPLIVKENPLAGQGVGSQLVASANFAPQPQQPHGFDYRGVLKAFGITLPDSPSPSNSQLAAKNKNVPAGGADRPEV